MKDIILVINGIDSADDLKPWGSELARKFSNAGIVIFIGTNGRPRIMKNREPHDIEYVDLLK